MFEIMADKAQTSSSGSWEKQLSTEVDQSKIMEQDWEYGYTKNDKFHTVTKFVLRCEGEVEEKEEVVGFMLQAKPKNNRNADIDEWQVKLRFLFLVLVLGILVKLCSDVLQIPILVSTSMPHS